MKYYVLLRHRSFYLISLIFSVLLLLLSLGYRIELMWTQSYTSELHSAIKSCAYQAELLRVKFENMLDLDELEKIALSELMMQKPASDQIVILSSECLNTEDERN